jgi:hypothetical protein
MNYNLTYYNDDICIYTGIPYTIETFELPPQQAPVTLSDFYENKNNGYWYFVLAAGCAPFSSPNYQYRFVSVSSDCSQVNFGRTLSTEETELTNVAIYPNPTSDFLEIQGITTIKGLEVYSIQGKRISISLESTTRINVSSLQSGIYFLKVTDDQNRSIVRKFIKK